MTEEEKKLLEATQKFQKSVDETKEIAEDIRGRYEKNDKVTEEMKQKADEAITKMNGLSAELEELKKHVSTVENRDGGYGVKSNLTAGQELIGSEQFKGRQWNTGDRQVIETKSIMISDPTSAGAFSVPQNVGYVALPDRKLRIYDLLSHGSMDNQQIYYAEETGYTNNAKTVAEGAEKPASDIKWKQVTENAGVIAHHIDVSRQSLSDVSYMQSLIDVRMRFMLELERDRQILHGNADLGELNGILAKASQYVAPTANIADATSLDTLRLAVLQAALANYDVTGFALHPTDCAEIELMKDTTGRYIIGNPNGNGLSSLWGLGVAQTTSIAQGDFLTGAFAMAAQYFSRWDATIAISLENKDNFTKNMATVLAEERGALAVYSPKAFVKGKLATAGGIGG